MRSSTHSSLRRAIFAGAVVAALSAASFAAAAPAATTKPTVATRPAVNVAPTSAILVGVVNPRGLATTYHFQYGKTAAYGLTTGVTAVGSGTAGVRVGVPITALSPVTTYHYRIVARNSKGKVSGSDATFKTPKIPLGLSLAAIPNPVVFGHPTTLAGFISGTGHTGRPVVLQGNPFPYTGGFHAVTNPQVTGASGAFSFPLLSVPITTQYRVVTTTAPTVVSPVVLVGVAGSVGTHVSSHLVRRGRTVRFTGTIRPALTGVLVKIQRRVGQRWSTLTHTISFHGGTGFARYVKRVRIHRGGDYRVLASIVSGNYVANVGRIERIHTFR